MERAIQLRVDERLILVRRLLGSINPPPSVGPEPALDSETRERTARIAEGAIDPVPAGEVLPDGPRYVSDGTVRTTAVQLPIGDYLRLIEDLQDLGAIAERRGEPTVSHEVVIGELKRDGLLPA